jgi:hypothetical protein
MVTSSYVLAFGALDMHWSVNQFYVSASEVCKITQRLSQERMWVQSTRLKLVSHWFLMAELVVGWGVNKGD